MAHYMTGHTRPVQKTMKVVHSFEASLDLSEATIILNMKIECKKHLNNSNVNLVTRFLCFWPVNITNRNSSKY